MGASIATWGSRRFSAAVGLLRMSKTNQPPSGFSACGDSLNNAPINSLHHTCNAEQMGLAF